MLRGFYLLLLINTMVYTSTGFTMLRGIRKVGVVKALLRMSSTSTQPHSTGPVPITVLSGFLGAGKTTFLHNTLSNREGKKFGLVVNDMATVNVDAKQIRQQTIDPLGGIDTMELQDGCVCCTLAEDLIASVSKLVTLSDLKKEKYDHIVVECSGIAEPRKIRELFQQAQDYKLDLLKKVQLDTLITLVDATVFLKLFGTDAEIGKNRNLAYKDQSITKNPEDKNTYIELDGNEQRKVTDLLLEQVECADIVLINKCDLLDNKTDVELVKKVITSINPTAKVLTCVNGVIPTPLSILGSANALGAADWGVLDEHRKLIKAVEEHNQHLNKATCEDSSCTDPTHHHEHHHEHAHKSHVTDCHDHTCTDPTHNHNHIAKHSHSATAKHDHGHHHEHTAVCHDHTCTDPSHHHDHTAVCHDHTCTDPSHNHDHTTVCHDHTCTDPSHNHDHTAVCHDHTCTDPSHNHDHSHSHAHDHNSHATTAEERFGITSFVYRRRRPFHPIRFSVFLQGLGKLSIKGVSEMSAIQKAQHSNSENNTESSFKTQNNELLHAKRALLRSKGFVWMGTSAEAAYFMSHAGQYLELLVLGRWWDAIDRKQWPTDEIMKEITVDFDGEHGDRRQELVFIGQFGHDDGNSQKALEKVLDSCLLTDEEMKEYGKVSIQGDEALRAHFAPGY